MSLRLRSGSYLGRTRRARPGRRFALVESEYAPHARLEEHAHDRPYLCFVLAGEYQEDVCGRAFACHAGTVVLHSRERSHRDTFGARGGRCFNVELDAGWLRANAAPALLADDVWHASPVACWPLLRRVHARLGERGGDDGEVERDLAHLLAALPSVASARDEPGWLADVERRLRESWRAPPGLAALARAAGVHPNHLTRAFRRRFGCSLGQFVRALRTEAAAREICGGGRALSDVALDAGFCDQSHLNRVFGRAVGVTPGEYRARVR